MTLALPDLRRPVRQMGLASFQRRFRDAVAARKARPLEIDREKKPRATRRLLRFTVGTHARRFCPITLVCWHETDRFYPVEEYASACDELRLEPFTALTIMAVADDWWVAAKRRA